VPEGGSPRALFMHHTQGLGLDPLSSHEGNLSYLSSIFLFSYTYYRVRTDVPAQ
jgi:hypothetical protein